MYVPTSTAAALAAALGGQLQSGSIIVPTSAITPSTKIGVTFGNVTFTFESQDIVLDHSDSSEASYILSIAAEDLRDTNGNLFALVCCSRRPRSLLATDSSGD